MKAVDDEPTHQRALVRWQEVERSKELSEDTTPVDVAHEHDRRVDVKREAHIRDVVGAKVHLGRAAGPLGHDDVVLLAQEVERFDDDRPEIRSVRPITTPGYGPQSLATDDHL